jgi:hypothetical protein
VNKRSNFSFLAIRIGLVGALVLAQSVFPAGSDEIAPACGRVVDEFLRSPTEALARSLNDTDSDGCWLTVSGSSALLDSLLTHVARGSTPAAHYLASHVRQLDGGNLEDSLRALGEFSERRMEVFFELEAKGLLSRNSLLGALTMLPIELADNPEAELSAMEARRAEVDRVDSADPRIRAEALQTIDSFIAEIKRARALAPAPAP